MTIQRDRARALAFAVATWTAFAAGPARAGDAGVCTILRDGNKIDEQACQIASSGNSRIFTWPSSSRTMLSESLRGVIAQVLCKKKGGGRVAAGPRGAADCRRSLRPRRQAGPAGRRRRRAR